MAVVIGVFAYKYLTKPVFRAHPTELSVVDVKDMIKKYDFFTENDNPNGKGFDNDFGLQKDSLVVYDHKSGLMWQQSGLDKQMESVRAKQWIRLLNYNGFAGFNDWRLPTLEEAMSLMEPDMKKGLYIDPIFDSKQV